ncbi:50S ribosomal protein L24 [Candidatus Peregrinibacteria bacterium RIFOXYB2_FULL_32_7]|nr:MAG: 50S ribosomal protein L24 [Candidatus Peregrinibacteria bacterium RIFOXYB2_FULL_32_7]
MKIKVNDNVLVITGKDKGKTGKVTQTIESKSKIVVQGVNIRKKHIKKTQREAGRIIEFEAPIHVSNAKVICPETKKASRVGYTMHGKKKIRIAKKSKEALDKKITTTKK